MEFTFHTKYDRRGTTAMAKVLRKTIRKKHSRRSHAIGIVLILLVLPLSLPIGGRTVQISANLVVTWLAMLAIIIALLWEDRLNGWIARRRMLAGTECADSVFREDVYTSETAVGKTDFYYEKIDLLAETDAYFVFVFGFSHVQIYDKKTLSGGSIEDFRKFITERTGKTMQVIK